MFIVSVKKKTMKSGKAQWFFMEDNAWYLLCDFDCQPASCTIYQVGASVFTGVIYSDEFNSENVGKTIEEAYWQELEYNELYTEKTVAPLAHKWLTARERRCLLKHGIDA